MNMWMTTVALFLQLLSGGLQEDCMIEENSQVFTYICNITELFPEIQNPNIDNFQNLFLINKNSLELLQSLDRENLIQTSKCDPSKLDNYRSNGQCTLLLELSGTGPRFYQLPIIVTDVNDNAPSFDRLTFTFKIAENSAPNNEVELPLARDPDRGHNGTVVYELLKTPVSDKFSLIIPSLSPDQESSLKLRVLQSFDREIDEQFQLTLVAQDMGTPSLSSSLIIKIEITDVNDHPPQFNASLYRFTIPESIIQGHPIGQVFALDKDITSRVFISISPSASSQIVDKFSVASDGMITTKVPLVYVSSSFEYRIPIIANDNGVPSLTATTTALVHVTDINDNSPIIEIASSNPNNRLTLMENCPPHTYIAKITVSDKDHGINGKVECKLDQNHLFNLESIQNLEARRHYKLITAQEATFDREFKDYHQLTIICNDMGTPSLTETKPITIVVIDENDNPPVFQSPQMSKSILENQPSGLKVTRLRASDKDIGINAQTKYILSAESLKYFSVDSVSGMITTTHSFDREQQSEYKIDAIAYDNYDFTMQSNVTITITILDENDNPPRFFKTFSFRIDENREGVLGQVEAKDNDIGQNAKVEYFLIMPSTVFEISKNGEIIVAHKTYLDRERTDHYTLEIGARDHGIRPLTSSTTVKIIIDDMNDNSPLFLDPKSSTYVNVSIDTMKGSKIYTVRAVDRDTGENAKIVYAIHPETVFSINSSAGCIFLLKSLLEESYLPEKLIIYAKDNGNPPKQSMSSLFINYIRNGKSKPVILEKRSEKKLTFLRDLVLSIGIGLVILIFICLVILIAYFCVSIVIQKRIQKQKSDSGDNKRQHYPSLYCLCDPGQSHHSQESIKNMNISVSSSLDRPTSRNISSTKYIKSKERERCLEEDPIYSYREFTMKPLILENQVSQPILHDRLVSPFAHQFKSAVNQTVQHHRFYVTDNHSLSEIDNYHKENSENVDLELSPQHLGDSNSSVEVNRIIYGESSQNFVGGQNFCGSKQFPSSPSTKSESDKTKSVQGHDSIPPEIRRNSSEQIYPSKLRYSGFLTANPYYANSFV